MRRLFTPQVAVCKRQVGLLIVSENKGRLKLATREPRD